VGDGPLRSELEKLADSLGILRFIKFTGVQYDIPSILSATDISVLASSYEGFGLVVAEAMSCERLVVATDCGGVKEVLGHTGILVSVDDNVSLFKGLKKGLDILSDPSLLEKMKVESRERVKTLYSLDNTSNEYLVLYKDAIESRS
jgi:glycosyltransferase involved in cell wall biosynthesis